MKRSVLLFALLGLFTITSQAQDSRPHCFTSEITNPLIDNDPQYRQNREDLERFTQDYIQNQSHQRQTSSTLYIIPVVFHILHNYGPENVSDDVIREAVRLMNIDYRKLNADTADIIPSFQGIAADCEIEFRLATIDPNGNCTNGIEHIPTLKTYLANDASKTDPNWMVWPNSKYLNIWVANTLENSQAAAYAHLPGGANSTDGIMCWYTYVNNVSRTLTHEAGHHFNLLHPWGNTNSPGVSCSGSDLVGDTPQTMGWDHCPNPNQAAICNPPVIENYQNFMDYSYCDVMFTQGQKARMVACLQGATSQRNNLWTNANLIATGTDQIITPACSPVADFKADSYSTCAGSTIRFFDQSWKGTPTGWAWEFPGGTPSLSNDTNPVITYNTPGVYTATLVVSNANGADTVIKSSIIHVSGAPQATLQYNENFEDSLSFPGIDGWIANNDGGSINWTRVNFASSDSGTYSIRVNNYVNTVRNVEYWVTPSFSFTGVTYPIRLSFDVAYARRSASLDDQLSIEYSNDCGLNWFATSYSKAGSALETNNGVFVTSSFTPTNQSQWRRETVTINPVQNLPNVRFRFINTTARGNNVYVDNINITGNFTGIDEEDNLQSAISVYPNPSQGSTSVDFNLIKGSQISIEVKDVIGQSVSKLFTSKRFESGLHHVSLPVLAPGIYMINVTVNNKLHVVKLVVS